MTNLNLPHHVTVETFPYSGDYDFEPTIRFECPWKYGACRFYPDCSCESFGPDHYRENGPGHERVWHEDCWMKDWFEARGICYTGDDADDMTDTGLPNGMNRAGRITTTWQDEYIEWEFTS